MEEKLEMIRGASIENALSLEYRQYLTGHLTREQPHLKHIDDDIEIGVSVYEAFTADKPHMHPIATEHGYVIEGSVCVCLLDESNAEYRFNAGDFFVIRPGVGYATKNAPGTKILFIKSPGVNDKVLVEVGEEIIQWLSAWEN